MSYSNTFILYYEKRVPQHYCQATAFTFNFHLIYEIDSKVVPSDNNDLA